MIPATGWAGYTWPTSVKADAQFRVPSVNGATPGSLALWSGTGIGDPGIQQAGVTVTVNADHTITCQAWFEMWPAPPHPYGGQCKPGDVIQTNVTRKGTVYTLSVRDVSRGWVAVTRQSYGHTEPEGEAIAEAYGPPVPGFAHLKFTTSGSNQHAYRMPAAYPKPVTRNSYEVLYA